MTHRFNLPIRLASMAGVLLMTVGCGPSRKAQCQDLSQATRTVMAQVEVVYQSQIGGYAYDPDIETQLAAAWDAGVTLMATVDLSDGELKAIRDQLVVAYQQAATLRREAAALIPAGGKLSAAAEAQVDALQLEAEAGIPPAIDRLNLYCIGG